MKICELKSKEREGERELESESDREREREALPEIKLLSEGEREGRGKQC